MSGPGGDPVIRDYGLLEAALARPQAAAHGEDAYPDLHAKAAALLHSLARNHALIDGDKRLALAATIAFLGINGQRLTLTNDAAYELVMAVATGEVDHASDIARYCAHPPQLVRLQHRHHDSAASAPPGQSRRRLPLWMSSRSEENCCRRP